ncbi:Ribbon-helix-helix protein, copG family [Butyrivibrio fibrisolvens DSM 3071]|uniref:Ribbon-helix-helix protein, copG family n=1 Tax=Butyrivibrio fibrisolvens DSM 3071 TaxID=1121131 RepID=A0A1M5Q122_BUTFI|nr:Ribbon-helix-helix protein, copG family [Butyrivibrio fibrisolvens DSM 3071]
MNQKRERRNPIQIYLNDDEKYILDNKIKASGMRSISEYIRHLIIYGYVYDIDYNYLQDYDKQLSIIGKNINMIRERIFKTGNIYEEDVKEIKELMEKVWHTHESMLSKVPLQKL